MYRDKESGGVRLQASILSGELKRVPVWTAFITHSFQSKKWMKRPGKNDLHLADLQRYIFSEDYTPQTAATGEHELTFATYKDLKEFVLAIEDLMHDH
ncbi:hypothetical protein ACLMJK_003238 [Lecanora helva]